MGLHLHASAGGFDEEDSSGDIPEADCVFDVGVEPAAGDIRDVERGAAHHAALFRVADHFFKEGYAAIDGVDVFGNADRDGGLGERGAGADGDRLAVEKSGGAALDAPHLVAHGVVNHADEDLAGPAERDAHGEVRDVVEKIHRAVDGVDDPLVLGGLVAAKAFLSVNRMVGVAVEDDGFDEGLTALVEFQLDVVGEVFIDMEGLAEIGSEKSAGGLGGVEGGLQVGVECHLTFISAGPRGRSKIFPTLRGAALSASLLGMPITPRSLP